MGAFMDALSNVLRLVRLGGAVYLNGDFTAPWCVVGAVTIPLLQSGSTRENFLSCRKAKRI